MEIGQYAATMPRTTLVTTVYQFVRDRRLFPLGEYGEDGIWRPTHHLMRNALVDGKSPASQCRTRTFIARLVDLMSRPNLDLCIFIYSGQDAHYVSAQPEQNYRRRRPSTGRKRGRTSTRATDDRQLTTIRITEGQRAAIDYYYPSVQSLADEVFTMVLERFQKEVRP